MSQQTVLLTQEGLEHRKQEYDKLINNKLPGVIDRLRHAHEQGPMNENSDYEAAKEELLLTRKRISELEHVLTKAQVISRTSHQGQIVDLGSTVTVQTNGKTSVYTLVGEWEVDPLQKKISANSPFGKALLGKRPGELVTIEVPAGTISCEVVSVS